jgi:CRP/FNR family transcriptional regulator, cyclic AMP receptor protein
LSDEEDVVIAARDDTGPPPPRQQNGCIRRGHNPPMARPLESDAAALAGTRPRRRFAAGDEIRDTAGSLHLFLEGRATLLAETPFGPHPVAQLTAPTLLDLRVPFGGSSGVARVAPEAGSVAAWFSTDDARALLFDASTPGNAFRRLALASLTAALRETNASLARFFDGMAAALPQTRAAKAAIEDGPIDPARASDLFETAGLDPALLPALGLVARTVPQGAALLVAGEPGEEAFLVAEGRLRVSLEIAGGEEALAFLGRGQIAGEMALLDDAPRSADVYAHGGPAVVYVLSRAVFRELLSSQAPEGGALLAGIALVLTRRLEEAIRKAAGFRILAGPT